VCGAMIYGGGRRWEMGGESDGNGEECGSGRGTSNVSAGSGRET
jgi:hypothetical protein